MRSGDQYSSRSFQTLSFYLLLSFYCCETWIVLDDTGTIHHSVEHSELESGPPTAWCITFLEYGTAASIISKHETFIDKNWTTDTIVIWFYDTGPPKDQICQVSLQLVVQFLSMKASSLLIMLAPVTYIVYMRGLFIFYCEGRAKNKNDARGGW